MLACRHTHLLLLAPLPSPCSMQLLYASSARSTALPSTAFMSSLLALDTIKRDSSCRHANSRQHNTNNTHTPCTNRQWHCVDLLVSGPRVSFSTSHSTCACVSFSTSHSTCTGVVPHWQCAEYLGMVAAAIRSTVLLAAIHTLTALALQPILAPQRPGWLSSHLHACGRLHVCPSLSPAGPPWSPRPGPPAQPPRVRPAWRPGLTAAPAAAPAAPPAAYPHHSQHQQGHGQAAWTGRTQHWTGQEAPWSAGQQRHHVFLSKYNLCTTGSTQQ